MHVDTEGTAVDLRDAQIHEVDQLLWQVDVLEGRIHAPESLVAFGRCLGIVDTVGHHESLGLTIRDSILGYPGLPQKVQDLACVLGHDASGSCLRGCDREMRPDPLRSVSRCAFPGFPRCFASRYW
ncbi:hypothetical protein D9M71_435480 [compost metagenome]